MTDVQSALSAFLPMRNLMLNDWCCVPVSIVEAETQLLSCNGISAPQQTRTLHKPCQTCQGTKVRKSRGIHTTLYVDVHLYIKGSGWWKALACRQSRISDEAGAHASDPRLCLRVCAGPPVVPHLQDQVTGALITLLIETTKFTFTEQEDNKRNYSGWQMHAHHFSEIDMHMLACTSRSCLNKF